MEEIIFLFYDEIHFNKSANDALGITGENAHNIIWMSIRRAPIERALVVMDCINESGDLIAEIDRIVECCVMLAFYFVENLLLDGTGRAVG